MIRPSSIYTRTGDKGKTSLGNGRSVPKDDPRIETLGTLDEANALLGVALLFVDAASDESARVKRIQNDLLDLGADLGVPDDPARSKPPRVETLQVTRLEEEIDAMNARLEPLSGFILPGGSPASAHLHLARAVVRRAERTLCRLAARETITPQAIAYVNRLSDYLFVLARALNESNNGPELWTPGAARAGERAG